MDIVYILIIMSEIVNLRVHIAPVGYEVDRIILPARRLRADKVILLVHENPSEDKATVFYEKIIEELKGENVDVHMQYHDRTALFQIIKTMRNLIRRESGNTIWINLASGSKIQAIGCMMASMMFGKDNDLIPFYVEAEEYLGFSGKPISRGIKEIERIRAYNIQIPEDRHIRALKIVVDSGGRISKKAMAAKALDGGLIEVDAENPNQATFASLDKNITAPLVKWEFVEVEKIGRTRWIKITKEGRDAAEFLI